MTDTEAARMDALDHHAGWCSCAARGWLASPAVPPEDAALYWAKYEGVVAGMAAAAVPPEGPTQREVLEAIDLTLEAMIARQTLTGAVELRQFIARRLAAVPPEGLDVERLAAAICNGEASRYPGSPRWDRFSEEGRDLFRKEARDLFREYQRLSDTGEGEK